MLIVRHFYDKNNIKNVLFFMLFIGLSLWALSIAWASIVTVRAENTIIEWEQGKKAFNIEASYSFENRLKSSISINALNSNNYLLLARLYEYRALNATDKNEQYKDLFLAEQYYIQSIEKQPSSYYTWARFAYFYNKYINQISIDKKNSTPKQQLIINTITQAIELGAFEAKTQPILIPLIFQHWDILFNKEHVKSTLLKILKTSFKSDTNSLIILNEAKKHHKLYTLKHYITKQWHKNFIKKHIEKSNKNRDTK